MKTEHEDKYRSIGRRAIEEAIQILSQHGAEAGVYAGGTDLLIRLKNRLTQAPTYLVDIKKIDNLRYIKEDAEGGVQIGALTKLAEMADSAHHGKKYPMLVKAVGRSPRRSCATHRPSAATCCRKSGASTCAAATPAGATAATSATARSATTATTTRRWAAGCATRSIRATSRRR